MAEQVPAPPAPNQVVDVVNIAPAPAKPAPEPVLAVLVAQVENPLPAAANNVAQNAAPEVTTPNFNERVLHMSLDNFRKDRYHR